MTSTDTTVPLPEAPYKAGHYCNKCGQYGSPTSQHTRPNSDQLCNYLAVQAPRFIDSDMRAYAAAQSAADNAALTARVKALEGALRGVLHRMDRARNILTGGKPRPECNWGMLDTEADRAALEATK